MPGHVSAVVLLVSAGVAELLLVAAVGAWRVRARDAERRLRRRFEEAAARARCVAHQVRIADARAAEVAELLVEQWIGELGTEMGSELGTERP